MSIGRGVAVGTEEGSTCNSIEGDPTAAVQMRDLHGDLYVNVPDGKRKRVAADVEAGEVTGRVTGVQASDGLGDVTEVDAAVKVTRVSSGGEVIGVDLGKRED